MSSPTSRPALADRLPPLPLDRLDADQRAAADALIAGPRKAVKGPFIPLLRSPELLARVQKVGEYLRFHSVLPTRVSEFAMLIVARAYSQQFEWNVHVPLALQAGTSAEVVAALRDGRRPEGMSDDEACVHDFASELIERRGVSEASYQAALQRFGERGVVDLSALIGYFVMVSMVLNMAHTPAEPAPGVDDLPAFPR